MHRFRPRLTIKIKLIALFLVVAVVPLAVATVVANNKSRDGLISLGETNMQSKAASTARGIDDYLIERAADVTSLGRAPDLNTFAANPNDPELRERARLVLTAALQRDFAYESIAIVDKQGNVLLSTDSADENTSVQGKPFFQQAVLGKTYISDPSVSATTNEPSIYFAAPVKTGVTQSFGVVRSRLSMLGLWARIVGDDGAVGKGSSAALFDENGLRLGTSDHVANRTYGKSTLLTAVAPVKPEAEEKIVKERRLGNDTAVRVDPAPSIAGYLSGGHGVFTFSNAQGENRATGARLEKKPWTYIVAVPDTTLTASADSMTSDLRNLAIAAGLVALAVAVLFSLSVTRPIGRLVKMANKVSMGESADEVNVRSNDEIGDLAGAFNRMLVAIKFFMLSDEPVLEETDETTSQAA